MIADEMYINMYNLRESFSISHLELETEQNPLMS